jgi:hypothetical protein
MSCWYMPTIPSIIQRDLLFSSRQLTLSSHLQSAGTSTSLEDLQGQLHHATRGLTRELRRAPDAVKILQVG